MTIRINRDLQSLIPALTPEESAQLEANLVAEGCRDRLIVWQEEQTLLDGHNRYDICERHGLTYDIHEISLADLDAAKAWLIANQLGRRNLTAEQISYFRGKQYDLQKKVSRGGGDHKSPEAHDQKPHNEVFDNTAQRLAVQHKVSKATIERDAAYARNIDTLADTIGPEARQTLLAREAKVSQHEVRQLAAVAQVSPSTAKEVLANVQFAKTPKAAKQMVDAGFKAAKAHIATVGSGNLVEAGVPRAIITLLTPKSTTPIPTAPTAAQAVAVHAPVPEPPVNGAVMPTSDVGKLLSETLGNIEMLETYYRATPVLFELHRDTYDTLKGACLRFIALLDHEAPVAPPEPTPRQQASRPQAQQGRTEAIRQMARKLRQFTCADLAKELGDDAEKVRKALKQLVEAKHPVITKKGTVYTWVVSDPSRAEAS